MKLEILLSTMNRNDIDDVFFEERKISGPCVVVNQNKEKEETIVFKNKKIVNTKTKGLSVSCNIALDNADCDICLIHDDNLYLEDNYENIILIFNNAFNTSYQFTKCIIGKSHIGIGCGLSYYAGTMVFK